MSFNPSGNSGISGATDVALNSPVDEQALSYDSSIQKWKNATVPTSETTVASNNLGSMSVTSGIPPANPPNDGKFHLWFNTAEASPTYIKGWHFYDRSTATWTQDPPAVSPPTLTAPTNIVATTINQTITVTWDAVANAEQYEVWEAATPDSPIAVVDTTSRTSGTLATGKTYTYRVRAIAGTSVGEFGYANTIDLGSPGGETPPPTGGGELMTFAELSDPTNFGVPSGTTLVNQAASSIANVSGQTFQNIRFTGSSGSSAYINGSDNTFINCEWPQQDIVIRGNGQTFTHCQAAKISFSSSSNNTVTRFKAIPFIGKDGMTVTSDRSIMSFNNVFDGFYAAGNITSLIGGSANHYDNIQIRGCNGLTMKNLYLDQGTTFSSYFNATIFLENANGGCSNVLIDNFYSRAAGYHHTYLFGTNVEIKNGTFARIPDSNLIYSTSWTFTESGHKWDDDVAITSLRTS